MLFADLLSLHLVIFLKFYIVTIITDVGHKMKQHENIESCVTSQILITLHVLTLSARACIVI